MREILFRGQDVRGAWHIGLLAHVGNAWYISNKAGIATAYEVIPKTIGQFTGLTDKDGKKIFEGDMVVSYDMLGYRDGCGVVNWNDLFVAWHIGEHNMYNRVAIYEVIGNIYDNPESLEVPNGKT